MTELKQMERVDLTKVDFRKVLSQLRWTARYSVAGVEWAELYVTADGRAIAVYRSGNHIRVAGAKDADSIVEWFDDSVKKFEGDGTFTGEHETRARRSYRVNLNRITKRGGVVEEEWSVRLFLNRIYDRSGALHELKRQRVIQFNPQLR